MKFKTAALALLAICMAVPVHARVDARMRNLFDSVGGYGTIDAPGIYNAANRNVFAAGSINFRAPKRTFNLLSARGPSLRAGCGGIDFYAGSFSFINRDEFVALLRNIAANSVGLAFKTALCATSANLCQAIEDLQKTLESLNRFNIDSCETAKSIVGGAFGKAERTSSAACLSVGRTAGLFADDSEGRSECATPAGFRNARTTAAAGADADMQPVEFVGGNLTWQVLGRIGGGLDTEDREFLMSMIGTQIVATDTLEIRHFPPTITELSDLHERRLPLLSCDEPVDCLNVTVQQTNLPRTFVEMASQRLDQIAANMRAGQPLNAGMLNLVAGAPFPVLALVRAEAAGASGLLDVGSEAVAYAIAFRFLSDSLRQATIAAASWRSRSATEAELARSLIDGSRSLRSELSAQLHASLARLSQLLEVAARIEETRRRLVHSQLRAASPN